MKAFVGLAAHQCPVCGQPVNEHLLINKQMKDTFEIGEIYIDGFELCDEHQRLFEEGYVALVAVSNPPECDGKGILLPQDAQRTGEIVHVHRDGLTPRGREELSDKAMVFVPQATIDKFKALQAMRDMDTDDAQAN